MRSQMTHKQLLSLAKYLETHKDRIHAERPSYAAVARQASAELGFDCSDNNVRAAAEACEMVWTARRTMGNGSRASRKHVSRVLARAVLEIADALDIKVDQNVHRIALGRRLEDEQPSGLLEGLHA